MYFMFDKMPGPVRWLGKDFQQSYWRENTIWWDDGVPFKEGLIPVPLRFELQPIRGTWDHGDRMQAYFKDADMPIFRDDLIAAMQEAGVDNLDIYETCIIDTETGEQYTNYKAVNIIGLISAADMEKSEAEVHDGIPLIDVSFNKLVLDERKTFNALIFRMAESNQTILVHKKLAKHILKSGFDKDILFHDLSTVGIL